MRAICHELGLFLIDCLNCEETIETFHRVCITESATSYTSLIFPLLCLRSSADLYGG